MIRNVAKELAIQKAINETPECEYLYLAPQTGHYLVSYKEHNVVKHMRVVDAAEARAKLNPQETQDA